MDMENSFGAMEALTMANSRTIILRDLATTSGQTRDSTREFGRTTR